MGNIASRDQNRVTVLMGVNDVTGLPQEILVNDDGEVLVSFASSSGTVTTVSVVSANGFAGTVANATTTPAITLSTTVTGILSGNGTAISAASTTGSGSTVVLSSSPTITTPVLTGLPTGTGVASAATVSTLAARDANGSLTANSFIESYTTTATAAGTTTLTVASTEQQFFTGSTTQTVTLPVTSTLALGQKFMITNNSTGLVTVNSSGANNVIILAGGTSAVVTCILTSGTTAASWSVKYVGIGISTGKKLSSTATLTLSGTDSTTMTFPTTTATIARTDAGQTFTGVQTMTSPSISTSLTTASSTFSLLNATATTINFAGASAAVVNFGGGASSAEFRFLEPSGSGSNYSAIKAQAQGANITYTLPATVASSGQVLTDAAGNGTLSWATPAGGANLNTTFTFLSSTGMNSIIRWDDATITKTVSGTNSSTNSNSMVFGLTSGNADARFAVAIDATGLFMNAPTWTSNMGFSGYFASDATTSQDIFVGIGCSAGPCASGTGVANDGTSVARHFGFYVDDGVIYASNADATTQTRTDVSSGITLTDMNSFRAVKTTSNITFYINETLVATHSTNLPTGTSTVYQVQAGIESRTTANRNLFLSKSFVYYFQRQ